MDDVGITERLVTDGAGEFTGKGNDLVKEACRIRIPFGSGIFDWW